MTYQEFLDRLRQTPRDWEIVNGRIRRDRNTCPIRAVDGRDGCLNVHESRKRLRLRLTTSARIVSAADAWSDDQPTRRDLLAACGLTEDQ